MKAIWRFLFQRKVVLHSRTHYTVTLEDGSTEERISYTESGPLLEPPTQVRSALPLVLSICTIGLSIYTLYILLSR